MPILALLLPALIPVVLDGLKGVLNWITGGAGAQPANVQEAIQLMEAEAKKMQALAALDTPAGTISQWVADLRASFRYLAAAMIIIGTFGCIVANGLGLYVNADVIDVLLQLSGSVFSFLFGDHIYIKMRRG